MKDPFDIVTQFKKNPNGQVVCFASDCPEITGIGQNEKQAEANFWKAYNKFLEKEENMTRMQNKADEAAKKAA